MDVHFIVMPFGSIHRPALGVSLLKAVLRNYGISSRIHYFNLKFAERIGLKLYDKIAENKFAKHDSLVGELMFAKVAFEEDLWKRDTIENILHKISENIPVSYLERTTDEMMTACGLVSEFAEECASEVLKEKPKLVGFTSTFHQNCSSICVAKMIKRESDVPIIFGGANCEGQMGATLLKTIPWIDFICSGEGEIAFIDLAKSLLKGESRRKVNGIITREASSFDIALTNPVMNMDVIPFPDFDEYFSALTASSIRNDLSSMLPLETSRGCWWGEKFQCTFCGLNGRTMKYRSKSIPRVLQELEYLIDRYKTTQLNVVDNILDLKYCDALFPEISRRNLKVEFFYEIKSNISKNQLSSMRKGGVCAIQPGIESFSDSILKIMKKGVTGLQNIQLLKWCRELDIIPTWNLLWGFPGEPKEEYDRMAELIPMLVHLYPPDGYGKIVLDRFSPYFLEPSGNGIVNIRPSVAYTFVYPFPKEDLEKIAYHFEFDYSDGRNPSSYVGNFQQEAENWRKSWEREHMPCLNMAIIGNLIMINDTRPCSIQKFQMLSKEKAEIYKICETVHTFGPLLLKIRQEYPHITENDLRDLLCSLIEKKLMVYDGEKYLSLAVQVN